MCFGETFLSFTFFDEALILLICWQDGEKHSLGTYIKFLRVIVLHRTDVIVGIIQRIFK